MLTKKYSDSLTFTNEYDEKGRISSSSYGETTVNYAYDTHGQLVSANEDTYDYDDRGNITSKTVGNTTTTVSYSNSFWKDELTSVNGTPLTYDENGNVLTYGNKKIHLEYRQKSWKYSWREQQIQLYLWRERNGTFSGKYHSSVKDYLGKSKGNKIVYIFVISFTFG